MHKLNLLNFRGLIPVSLAVDIIFLKGYFHFSQEARVLNILNGGLNWILNALCGFLYCTCFILYPKFIIWHFSSNPISNLIQSLIKFNVECFQNWAQVFRLRWNCWSFFQDWFATAEEIRESCKVRLYCFHKSIYFYCLVFLLQLDFRRKYCSSINLHQLFFYLKQIEFFILFTRQGNIKKILIYTKTAQKSLKKLLSRF